MIALYDAKGAPSGRLYAMTGSVGPARDKEAREVTKRTRPIRASFEPESSNAIYLRKFHGAGFTEGLANRRSVSRDDYGGSPVLGRSANWKMRVAQCKRMAESAIDIAAIGTSEQAPEYLEIAADFLKLAHDIEHQHAACADHSPLHATAAAQPKRLAA